MQEGQIDVALEMWRKPWFERGSLGGLSFAVEVRENGERTDEDEEVGERDRESQPVYGVEGPHGGQLFLQYSGDGRKKIKE